MKYLIAGYGSIGRRHFQNLKACGEEDILFLRSHRSTLPDDELSGYVVETDLDKALSHQPDAVIISNPTALHLDIAIPAAQQGCHLFLEKPISHDTERVDELVKAVDYGGGQVFVGFQFRFHPALKHIKNIIESGELGKPLSVRAHWGEYLPAWHPWEDYRKGYSARKDLGGGVVLTLCHPFDYLRWLMGEVEHLWAFTDQVSELDLPVEDVAEVGLRFKNHVTGSVHLDYFQQPASHYLEIIFSQGYLRWDYTGGGDIRYRTAEKGQEEIIFKLPDYYDRNDMFLDEISHFIDIVDGDSDPICTLEDGIMALRLALAVHESNRTGRRIEIEK